MVLYLRLIFRNYITYIMYAQHFFHGQEQRKLREGSSMMFVVHIFVSFMRSSTAERTSTQRCLLFSCICFGMSGSAWNTGPDKLRWFSQKENNLITTFLHNQIPTLLERHYVICLNLRIFGRLFHYISQYRIEYRIEYSLFQVVCTTDNISRGLVYDHRPCLSFAKNCGYHMAILIRN